VDLDQAPGLNPIGETALHNKINNHYFSGEGSSSQDGKGQEPAEGIDVVGFQVLAYQHQLLPRLLTSES
jgi:hypothetical protein